jgi:hypothetical protein
MNILDPALRTLKLTGILDILDLRLVQTRDGGSYANLRCDGPLEHADANGCRP